MAAPAVAAPRAEQRAETLGSSFAVFRTYRSPQIIAAALAISVTARLGLAGWRWSDVLIMPQYRISHTVRIVQNLVDVLRTHDHHANGWRLWSDRVFYHCDDGQIRSVTNLFGNTPPAAISFFLGLVQFAAQPRVRRLLHDVFSIGEGVAL